MQIVIDIDEEIYNYMKERFMYGYADTELDKVGLAVRNGTPLQKGHGRLGDLDELETYFKNVRRQLKPEDYKYAVEYFTRDNMLLNAEQFIHLMDAVVPAMEVDDEN